MRQKFFTALLLNFFGLLLVFPAFISHARPQALDLWTEIAQNFNLSNTGIQQADVDKQIRQYVKQPQALKHLISNANPYLYYVYQQIQQRGLPAELALIPLIESSYNPFEQSSAGASGLWQMMPTTAAQYGLSINSHFDGRLDVIASTKAALDHFSNLHSKFGDWLLAIIAYDAGAGKVHSTLVQSRQESLDPTDFDNLSLPDESRTYLTKLLALATIIKNPQRYHVNLPYIENKPFFEVYKISSAINLEKLASLSKTDFTTIQRLNPQLSSATKQNHYALLIPQDKANLLEKNKEIHASKTY